MGLETISEHRCFGGVQGFYRHASRETGLPMRPMVVEAVGQMLRTGQAIPSEVLTLQARDGSPVHVHSGHVLVDVPGQPPMFFCIDFDLTERMAAESTQRTLTEQLQQAQKMEALGTLAGGIAHDFNNIVAAILGNTELALGDVPADSPAHVSLSEIRKAARRARSLVQQILTFARRQAQGRVALDPGEVLRETHGILRSTLPPGVQLRFSVPPQLPAVQGNATQLAQVFLNLVTNAIQAVRGREGAEVVVEATPCPGPPTAPEGGLEVMMPADRTLRPGLKVQVHDNGHGIDNLESLFEPFYTTKKPGEGVGLGLAIRIEDLHLEAVVHELAINAVLGPVVERGDAERFHGCPRFSGALMLASASTCRAPSTNWTRRTR